MLWFWDSARNKAGSLCHFFLQRLYSVKLKEKRAGILVGWHACISSVYLILLHSYNIQPEYQTSHEYAAQWIITK